MQVPPGADQEKTVEFDDKRRLRKTKAAIKRSGQRSKRRTLRAELAQDPEAADPSDAYRPFDRSDSSREFAERNRGRLA